MIPEIITKIQKLLDAGIKTEDQVISLLVRIRKLIEQESNTNDYGLLKFYCDWILHSKLKGTMAQEILEGFNEAHIQLSGNIKLSDLEPPSLRLKVDNISKMSGLKEELSNFFSIHKIKDNLTKDSKSWLNFILEYCKVVSDCPLEINPHISPSSNIKSVIVKVEVSKKKVANQLYFKVSWLITDKDKKHGEIFVINAFEQ